MTTNPAPDDSLREDRLRQARSETIEWLVALGSHNSAAAEQTCRGLARRYRLDAARQRHPVVRAFATESAETFERIAEDLQRSRGLPR